MSAQTSPKQTTTPTDGDRPLRFHWVSHRTGIALCGKPIPPHDQIKVGDGKARGRRPVMCPTCEASYLLLPGGVSR